MVIFTFCNTPVETKTEKEVLPENTYLGHLDTTKYVGMNSCKLCHQSIYNSFINTGMGRSFHLAAEKNSAANFNNNNIYDSYSNFNYKAYLFNDSIFISEFRIDKNDTIFKRTEQVSFIIGSGQHTNSHLQNTNGYVHQMPMTFYTQSKKWDLPPGFENGVNTRFTRKIGLECMSCHNAFPEFEMGSENKYKYIGQGIDCERCHGPGAAHVAQKQAGNIIDTSKYIDYSIVNPAKLSIDLQFDICQRCHLQGNAVLKNNHSFFDFKPGKKLSNYISVFLPKYSNADDEFIMASHSDRLKQSACFIKSLENNTNNQSLKPYKNALTCVTCHNPHVSVKETNQEKFNNACKNCHGNNSENSENIKTAVLIPAKVCLKPDFKSSNCVACHMPSSGSIDIPHVTVHDHYIRKPINNKEKNKIKNFLGLYAINEAKPDSAIKAKAYLQQYEKFEQKSFYLDSASNFLNDKSVNHIQKNFHSLLHLNFLKGNYQKIIQYVNALKEDVCFKQLLTKKSYDNKDAWAAYHIAEAFYNTGNLQYNLKWLKKATELASFNIEYKVKLATTLAQLGKNAEAVKELELALKLNPKNISALTNLGYLKLLEGNNKDALILYQNGLKLDPDYEPLLMNLAGYYMAVRDKNSAIAFLNKIIKKNPKNKQALQALKQIQSLN